MLNEAKIIALSPMLNSWLVFQGIRNGRCVCVWGGGGGGGANDMPNRFDNLIFKILLFNFNTESKQ